MGFYEEISKYYDYIFPVGENQISFIEKLAGTKGNKILDVACGSGGYSAALAKRGYNVTAVDLDSAMVDMAIAKMENGGYKANVLQADMLELRNKINDKFNCVFCIGNSLVHLGSLNSILVALKQMNELLLENGALLIQIINYDRIIKYGLNELPPIINKEAGIEFLRKYEHNKTKGVINFNTTLSINEDGNTKVLENSVELLPVLSHELLDLLKQAGFKDINFYGDFNRAPFDDSSFVMVAEAFK